MEMFNVRLHPDDIAAIVQGLSAVLTAWNASALVPVKDDLKLLNLKELSEALGIPYKTLQKKKLPFTRLGGTRRGNRKCYVLSKVRAHLKMT